MSLIQSLRDLGSKVGILHINVETADAEPTRITTRSISLQELTMELHAAEVAALADSPAQWHIPYDQMFEAAGIKPSDASVDRLHELVNSPAYKDTPREKAQSAVIAELAAKKVTVDEVVHDAVARDHAIDAYAQTLHEKRQVRRRAQSQRRLELQNQIAGLQAELERINDEAAFDDQHWSDWWRRKLAYENQMAAALSYILPTPIITIDAQLPPDQN